MDKFSFLEVCVREVDDKTVSLFWVRGILDTAETQGVSQLAVIEQAGLKPSLLNEQGERISLNETLALWRSAEELSADPFFGIHMGQLLNPSQFQVLSFTLLSSETLSHAFDKVGKYQRLLSDGGELSLRELNAEEVEIVYTPAQDGFSRHQIEAVMCMLLNFSRWLSNRHLVPNSLSFTHDVPSNLEEYQSFFECEPIFGAKENSLSFSSEVLLYPLAGVNNELAKLHEQLADAELEKLVQDKTLANRVLNALKVPGQLHMGREQIAKSLAMSGRSLQRKLKEEGTSFQELYDKQRHQLALSYLDRDMGMNDVSENLGFAELSAFYRAFKRWHGITPGEYKSTE